MAPEPERIEFLGFTVTFLDAGPDRRVSLLEWQASGGAGGAPIHVHDRTEEGFYILRGQLALWIEGEEMVREKGSYTVVRAGEAHSFWNPTGEPAAFLTPIAPGGFEGYLRELAAGLESSRSEAEAAALRERLSERYDIRVVGPPPG